jgi:hypothetical protein
VFDDVRLVLGDFTANAVQTPACSARSKLRHRDITHRRHYDSEDEMTAYYSAKWKIVLLFGAVLIPALSHAQYAQISPLPRAPPEIMADDSDAKACAQQGLTVRPGNRLQSSETTGNSLSEQLSRSDGVICPPSDRDVGIRAPTPEAGHTPVISPSRRPGDDRNMRRSE